MALLNARPLTIRPRGITDSIDGTNAAQGSMAVLANLVPATHTAMMVQPRPAAQQETAFSGFVGPVQGEALFVVGTRQYGLVASQRFPGKSEPFVYDTAAAGFVAVFGVTSNNTPNSISQNGDWEPPTVARVGGRVLFTSPGFVDPTMLFGWLDMTGFSSNAITGTTHNGTRTIDGLSANALQAGWRPGQTIAGTNIAAGTRLVSIASNGLSAVISQAATAGSGGVAFTVAGGTAAAPLWCAGNTNGNALPQRPTAAAQFSGRAYYAIGSAVAYSDSGDPLQLTSATNVQFLTFQNGLTVTALAGLPLNNLQGGIIQSLIAFQGAGAIQQITGDQAFNSLNVNTLNESTGTLAPNTIAPTPFGLMFVAPDGLRLIDFAAHISEPIGLNGEGIALPFINAVNPSRMCAAYNNDVLRISVFGNTSAGGVALTQVTWQEFWYHLKLRSWSGPHSFPARLIAALATAQVNTFVMFPTNVSAPGLWTSNTIVGLDASYIENGAILSWYYQTSLLPDTGEMAENLVVESALAIQLPPNQNVTVTASNENGSVLSTVIVPGVGTAASLWGSMIWGSGLWGSGQGPLQQRRIAWDQPLVFKQMQITVSGQSVAALAIGNLYLKYQRLGYLMEGLPNAV